jgi:hypothetical protein
MKAETTAAKDVHEDCSIVEGPSTTSSGSDADSRAKTVTVSGEPLLWMFPRLPPLWLLRPFRHFRLLQLPLWMSLRLILWTTLHPPLQPQCLSIRPSIHLSVLAGTCCVTRPGITVDTSGHVLLGSYHLVYKVSPSMGILILSSLRIPPLGA